MARYAGREWSRGELLRLVGSIDQIARVRPCRLVDGWADGMCAVDVATGSGLSYTIVPSRGLDVTAASYCGHSLAWHSAQGETHPAFYDSQGLGWLRSFGGGLLTSCGLCHFGAPCQDGDTPLGLHGRISNTPAAGVSCTGEWIGDEYALTVRGTLTESVLFGERMVLRRSIRSWLGRSVIEIDDEVTNEGFAASPLMMLYHINIGFPVVAPGARVVSEASSVEPRDAVAAGGLDQWTSLCEPTPQYAEQVFFHQMPRAGVASAAVVNPHVDGGIGVVVRFDPSTLPQFTQWKNMACGAYVVGLEPGNARVMGRPVEREAGRLQTLEPGGSCRFHVEIEAVAGDGALALLDKAPLG